MQADGVQNRSACAAGAGLRQHRNGATPSMCALSMRESYLGAACVRVSVSQMRPAPVSRSSVMQPSDAVSQCHNLRI